MHEHKTKNVKDRETNALEAVFTASLFQQFLPIEIYKERNIRKTK